MVYPLFASVSRRPLKAVRGLKNQHINIVPHTGWAPFPLAVGPDDGIDDMSSHVVQRYSASSRFVGLIEGVTGLNSQSAPPPLAPPRLKLVHWSRASSCKASGSLAGGLDV